MKRQIFETAILMALISWVSLEGWLIASLILTAVIIILLSFSCYSANQELRSCHQKANKYARSHHIAEMILGNIRYRIQNRDPVDVDELLAIANRKMDGAEALKAYHFLTFDDGTRLPYWEPDDEQRGKHVLSSLMTAARATEGLPDAHIYSDQIMDVYRRISSDLNL